MMEDWLVRLDGQPAVSKAEMNRLVMDYLVIEGHKEAAETFRAESATTASIDLETIADRRSIRMAMERGDVAQAVAHATRLSPELLSGNPELSFRVHQQQLIELIRDKKIDEAIAYAQRELAPRAEASEELMYELECTMVLLVYEDLNTCPEAELLSQAQRQQTASQLNSAVLTVQAQETEAALPMLLRRLHWAQDELSHRVTFPRIDDYNLAQLSAPPEEAEAMAEAERAAARAQEETRR